MSDFGAGLLIGLLLGGPLFILVGLLAGFVETAGPLGKGSR